MKRSFQLQDWCFEKILTEIILHENLSTHQFLHQKYYQNRFAFFQTSTSTLNSGC